MITWTMATLYAMWLVAGALDFHFHQRTDISHTSSLRESALHGVQLCLIGGGTLAWLLLANTFALVAGLAGVAAAHAVAGYLDTVSADRIRRISPAEQHIHSILDFSPWAFLVWIASRSKPEWSVRLEVAPVELLLWVLVPALILAVAPWIYELVRCLRARRVLLTSR